MWVEGPLWPYLQILDQPEKKLARDKRSNSFGPIDVDKEKHSLTITLPRNKLERLRHTKKKSYTSTAKWKRLYESDQRNPRFDSSPGKL
jgi:hypothetical protein